MTSIRARCRAYVRAHTVEAVHVSLRDLPTRVLLAAALAYPRQLLQRVSDSYALWAALPGDRFIWFVCDLTLEVVAVPRPGRPVLRVVGDSHGQLLPYRWKPTIYRVDPDSGAPGTVRPFALFPAR